MAQYFIIHLSKGIQNSTSEAGPSALYQAVLWLDHGSMKGGSSRRPNCLTFSFRLVHNTGARHTSQPIASPALFIQVPLVILWRSWHLR